MSALRMLVLMILFLVLCVFAVFEVHVKRQPSAPLASGASSDVANADAAAAARSGQQSRKAAVPASIDCERASAADYQVRDESGVTRVDLRAELEGVRVALVVNVASQCGFTESGYAMLRNVVKHFSAAASLGEHDLLIMLFPSNSFAKQEPGTLSEIKAFARSKGVAAGPRVRFYGKIELNARAGAGAVEPFFRYLGACAPAGGGAGAGGGPTWNWNAYLVVRGRVTQHWKPGTSAAEIVPAIEKGLA